MTLVALQWHTEVKYVVDMPLVHGIGGFIVTKSAWDKVPPAHQKVISEAMHRYLPDIHAANRRDDQIVADSLLKQGIQNIAPPKEMMESFQSDSKAMQQKMVGDLYPQEILDQVLAELKEFRAKNPLPGLKGALNAKP
jgi:TRAP-type C4-dicarboxylate transport system substrate-binding protein